MANRNKNRSNNAPTTNTQAAATPPQAAIQPAPAAPTAPATAAPATVPAVVNPLLAQLLAAGKPYNVRPNTASDNAATWALLQGALQTAGGVLTRAQLQAVAQTRNHSNFVGYALRRGWLVAAPTTVATPSATPAATPAA